MGSSFHKLWGWEETYIVARRWLWGNGHLCMDIFYGLCMDICMNFVLESLCVDVFVLGRDKIHPSIIHTGTLFILKNLA